MKKIILSLFLIFTLSGCWNYHELNNYSIVTGVAIDKVEDEYQVSVLIANTPKNESDKEQNSSKIVVYSGNGDTIFTAIKEIGLISAKELYMGHFAVLVISEDVAKDGISEVIDMFLRESSTKKNFYVVVAKDCKAKDTLKIITPLSNFPSQNIADNLESTSQLQGIVSNVTFNELLSNLEKEGTENTINSLNIVGSVKEGSNKENVEESEPKTYVKLGPLGLFKGDKLIYWTNQEESVGINTIKNNTKEMYIKVKYNDSIIIIETTDVKTKTDVKLVDNNPYVNISITGEAKIVEISNGIDLNSDKVINLLKDEMNKQVINYVNQGIYIAFKNKTDVFGFGLMFYQNYPNYYNNIKNTWENDLYKIKLNIKSDIILKTKGSSKESLEDNND